MTQLKVDTITDAAGTAAPDLEDGLTVNGAALSTVNTAEYYSSGTEPSSPKTGAIWWDTANDKVMIYVDDEWREVELGASAASAVWYGDRGLELGGQAVSTKVNTIDYIDITTTGNATDFGDLTEVIPLALVTEHTLSLVVVSILVTCVQLQLTTLQSPQQVTPQISVIIQSLDMIVARRQMQLAALLRVGIKFQEQTKL